MKTQAVSQSVAVRQSGPGHSEDTGCVTVWQSVSQDLDIVKTQAVSQSVAVRQSGPGHSEDTGCVTVWQSGSQDLDIVKRQSVSQCGSQSVRTWT